jgi:hypothetical protein
MTPEDNMRFDEAWTAFWQELVKALRIEQIVRKLARGIARRQLRI